jgi:predicted membrane-bound spermidine synthase
MIRIPSVRKYEYTAFITGFALMVFELVASRILAPTIGSSTYVWTSVIGVIIAALSLGYAVGGWLADKRVASSDIGWLLLATACTVAATLVFSDGILRFIGDSPLDARLKGLIASLLLFMPTSFILGTISPYLVRLHTESITVAGRSVASLSALNALGGIVGTFLAGFIFFSYIGSRQTLGLLIALLVVSSWLLLPLRRWKLRLAVTVIVALATFDSLMPRTIALTLTDIDTPTAHYKVISTMYNGQPLRALSTGPNGWQSGVFTEDPEALAFNYTKAMATMVAAAPQKDRILVLGGGAFTLPKYLAKTYPASSIDVVEIDPGLPAIAREYFYYNDPPNVRIIADDGRAYLESTDHKYDLILVDIYSDTTVPFATATAEYTAALRHSLEPQGSVIANVIGADTPDCRPLLGALNASYRTSFRSTAAVPLMDSSLSSVQNIIVVYSNAPLDWAGARSARATLPQGTVMYDDFAPMERYSYQCLESR